MMNSSMYHQTAKATVADRLLAAEHAKTRRAICPARKLSLPIASDLIPPRDRGCAANGG